MYISTLTISDKGLILLPKKVRDILGTNTVSLTINDQNQVILSPISELGGTLSDYNINTELSFNEIRDQSWQDQNSNKLNSTNIPNDNNGDHK